MNANEVKVGSYYRAAVSGKLSVVHITSKNKQGGWDALNVATGRKLRIKSATRLKGQAKDPRKGGSKLSSPVEGNVASAGNADSPQKSPQTVSKLVEALKSRLTPDNIPRPSPIALRHLMR